MKPEAEKLIKTLEQLDLELNAKRGFFSKKIDIEKCSHLVGVLLSKLPSELARAEVVLETQKTVLENADLAAQNTIKEAEERAAHIVENSELANQAQIEAQKIIADARIRASSLEDKTKQHLDTMFKELEQFLLSVLAMIRNNREELRGVMMLV